MNFLKRRAKGQIMIITVLALPAMLGALALTCDMAVMYVTWSNLQRAADASTLAGANALPSQPTNAVTDAQRYANANGILSSEIVSTTVSGTNQSITMVVQRVVPHLFGRVVGLFTAPIQVQSIAAMKPANGPLLGLVPLGVFCGGGAGPCNLVSTGKQGAGNWGFVQLDGPGGTNLANDLATGANTWVSNGTQLYTKTGCSQGDIGNRNGGMTQRLADAAVFEADPAHAVTGTVGPDNFFPGDPRAVEAPVVSTDPSTWFGSGKGASQTSVVGFVALWISGTDCNSVTGTVIPNMTVTTARPGGPGTCLTGQPCKPVLVPVAI